MTSPPHIDLGNIKITRLVEASGPLLLPAELFPDSSPAIIERNLDWLVPRFYDTETQKLIICIQSFLLQTSGLNILVDTCVGDCKPRVRGDFDQQKWGWLDKLAELGLQPEDIDIVLSTHLHVDHVGWHTRLVNGQWQPTFTQARYLFSQEEWAYWRDNEGHPALQRTGDYIGDSVWPLFDAGLADLVHSDHEVAPGIRLLPLPGHTPGHVGVEIQGEIGEVILTGDLFHHPLQCSYPHWSTRFCIDPDASRQMRERMLKQFAEQGTRLLPAHVPSPTLGRVERVQPDEAGAHPDHVYRYRLGLD